MQTFVFEEMQANLQPKATAALRRRDLPKEIFKTPYALESQIDTCKIKMGVIVSHKLHAILWIEMI